MDVRLTKILLLVIGWLVKNLDYIMFVQPEQFSEHLRIVFTRELAAFGSLITILNLFIYVSTIGR